MNRTLVIGTALAATICAAGCGTSGAAKTAPATTASTPQQRYITALRHLKADLDVDAPEVQAMGAGQLLRLGRTACAYLQHPAAHPYGPTNDIIQNGYVQDPVTAAAVTKEAKTYLCPPPA